MGSSYDMPVLDRIKVQLLQSQCTVAIAESVTSGMVQHAFSQVKDAMQIYQGGVTTYNLGQKTSLLAVDPIHALLCNCVSEQVAIPMALTVAKMFRSQYGIAVTGYASPVPELGIKDLFAHYAISKHNNIIGKGKIQFLNPKDSWDNDIHADVYAVQCDFTNQILRIFLQLIS